MQGFTSASSEHRMDEPTHSLLSGPVTHTGHLYESYACHDFKAEAPSTTVRAGAPLTVEWDLEAKHPGDCDQPPLEPETPLSAADTVFALRSVRLALHLVRR